MNSNIRVVIADDFAALRDGLKTLISAEPDIEVVGEATDGDEAVKLTQDAKPDVLLLDLTMPRCNGLEALKTIRERDADVRILVLTMHDDLAYLRAVLGAGGSGYVVKHAAGDQLITAIREVYAGRSYINVALQQSLLHRLVGVAEVKLESAGGAKPEGQMRVLSLADAHALEAQIRAHARVAQASGEDAAAAAAAAPVRELLSMSSAEVVRYGLISNRGMIVVAAGFGALAQTGSDLFGEVMRWLTRDLFGVIGNGQDTASLAFGVAAMLVLFVIVLIFGWRAPRAP